MSIYKDMCPTTLDITQGAEIMDENEQPFPVDWYQWRPLWDQWLAKQKQAGAIKRSSWRFPAPNFIADEVLGTYSISERNVELSEVTFPDLSGARRGERCRYVGITYGTGAGIESGGIAATFGELERALGIEGGKR